MNPNDILTCYFNQQKKFYQINHLANGSDEIVTPFVDNLNDNISVYLEIVNDEEIQLSDDGYILNNFELMGVKMTVLISDQVKIICQQYDVTIDSANELSIKGAPHDFPSMMVSLISTILKIYGLSLAK